MIPNVSITNKDALLALLRSGDPYVVECEVSASSTVSYFYRKDSEDAVAKVVVEGKHIGAYTNLSQRLTCEDESAVPELQRLEAEMRQAQSAH